MLLNHPNIDVNIKKTDIEYDSNNPSKVINLTEYCLLQLAIYIENCEIAMLLLNHPKIDANIKIQHFEENNSFFVI